MTVDNAVLKHEFDAGEFSDALSELITGNIYFDENLGKYVLKGSSDVKIEDKGGDNIIDVNAGGMAIDD